MTTVPTRAAYNSCLVICVCRTTPIPFQCVKSYLEIQQWISEHESSTVHGSDDGSLLEISPRFETERAADLSSDLVTGRCITERGMAPMWAVRYATQNGDRSNSCKLGFGIGFLVWLCRLFLRRPRGHGSYFNWQKHPLNTNNASNNALAKGPGRGGPCSAWPRFRTATNHRSELRDFNGLFPGKQRRAAHPTLDTY